MDGFVGGLDRAGYEPLLSGVSSAPDVHEASAIVMVAPESTAPLAVVASIGRIPIGRMTDASAVGVPKAAPGTVDADADAVVSSEAQYPAATE